MTFVHACCWAIKVPRALQNLRNLKPNQHSFPLNAYLLIYIVPGERGVKYSSHAIEEEEEGEALLKNSTALALLNFDQNQNYLLYLITMQQFLCRDRGTIKYPRWPSIRQASTLSSESPRFVECREKIPTLY